MYIKINTDHSRFRQIIKGRIKKNLKKYISQGEMIGKKGKDLVSIPVPTIDLPHFEYGDNRQSGVGSGDGDVGSSLGPGQQGKDGQGQAGSQEGTHIHEVDVNLDELAEMMGEELQLPNIQPKGNKNLKADKTRYTSIHSLGPKSLLHFKRTYKEALKRSISSGGYNPQNPNIVPEPRDYRFRSWKVEPVNNNSAVIFFMMDVSGSMGDEQKNIVRTQSFWIDTWLKSQYQGIETRYIIHDAVAHEVDRDTFFTTRESGGTIISSAYLKTLELIENHYPVDEWNMYAFHFSDGDNWSAEDSQRCFDLLRDQLLPKLNMFCYGQVESLYGSGQFYRELNDKFKSASDEENRIICSRIPNRDAIYESIKEFLGKGY